jgi:hypothetical protein
MKWLITTLFLLVACTFPGLNPADSPELDQMNQTETAGSGETATIRAIDSPEATHIPTATPVPLPDELVWFAPNMGSQDFTRLFTETGQWQQARERIDVFKFYTQNVLPHPCEICGDNTLTAFADAQAPLLSLVGENGWD